MKTYNEMTIEELKSLIKENGLKISVKGKSVEDLRKLVTRALPQVEESDDEEEEEEIDTNEEIIEVPDWTDGDIESVSIDEVMDKEYFEEEVLKRPINSFPRLPRNESGHARVASRKVRLWVCNDCFPSVDKEDDPETYAKEAAELKQMPHIVTMSKLDPLCNKAKWLVENDGKQAIDQYGNTFRIKASKELARINYFLHVDSFFGEDNVSDMEDFL
jgi:hypothetical protein